MEQFSVLIVDDSAFMRRAISLLFEKDPAFYIVGIARNGIEALEKIERFHPDVITMDVAMPEMDGIEALERIMGENPVPVVMLSNHTGDGTESTIRALQLGAVDFFLKDKLLREEPDEAVKQDFLERMKAAARAKVKVKGMREIVQELPLPVHHRDSGGPRYELLVIGCSTGGPSALQSILPRFPEDYPLPVIVIQHMPPGFTRPLAERFNNICRLRVREAENGDIIAPGTIFIAPAGYQTLVNQLADGQRILRIVEDQSNLYKPSVNVTLQSVASLYKESLLVTVLTGMGNDGLEGCRSVREHQGRVIVEAEETCIVYGMPKVIYEAGLAHFKIPLPQIYPHLMSYL